MCGGMNFPMKEILPTLNTNCIKSWIFTLLQKHTSDTARKPYVQSFCHFAILEFFTVQKLQLNAICLQFKSIIRFKQFGLLAYDENCDTARRFSTITKIGLVSLFDDLSTFVGYLILKPILVEE